MVRNSDQLNFPPLDRVGQVFSSEVNVFAIRKPLFELIHLPSHIFVAKWVREGEVDCAVFASVEGVLELEGERLLVLLKVNFIVDWPPFLILWDYFIHRF